jgi:septal ring factor EnvC (AmiA/AmiB activator)
MRRGRLALLLVPFLAAAASAQDPGQSLDKALRAALNEQAKAEAETRRLEEAASQARSEAERLRAQEAAAAQAIEAAEARISAANAALRLTSAYVAAHRQQLAVEQQPVSSLLAGLATMARRPPLLVLADEGGTEELVKVRLLLQSTMPEIRRRTRGLSAELARGEKLKLQELAARSELAHSRDALLASRERFAALEANASRQAIASGGRALGSGDAAIAASEEVERLRGEQAGNQSIRSVAWQMANEDAAPPSPFGSGSIASLAPFPYALPAAAPVTEGVASVNESGVRSRGLTLATSRGMPLTAPADGIVSFAGPFKDYDGVLVIDHGHGWMSLIVNVATPLHAGDRLSLGQDIGRAIGPLQVELSQNGRRISPAIIAGSSQNLSKDSKGR